MSQLRCHIADTATPQGQARAVTGPWEVPVYKDWMAQAPGCSMPKG